MRMILAAAILVFSTWAAQACVTEEALRAQIKKDENARANFYTVQILTGAGLNAYRDEYNRLANLHNKTEGKVYFVAEATKLMLVFPKRMPSVVFLHAFKKDNCEFWRGYIPMKHHRMVVDSQR